MKHQYTGEQLKSALIKSIPIVSSQHVDTFKAALEALPEPPPPAVDGKTPGQAAHAGYLQAGNYGSGDKWECAASAVLAAFGSPQLSTLRPISEAGDVPAGCVRIRGYKEQQGEWHLATWVNSEDTHFADIRLPVESSTKKEMPCGFNSALDVMPDEPTPEPGIFTSETTITPMALGGQMYWRDLARQLAEVWWKCHNIGASLQHGDIDTDVSFSVVCERHGGRCFHADTPLNAWLKAEKWLMSPDRENFPAATLIPA